MSQRLRLACRVCLSLGVDDPEAWLNQISPRAFALWQAFYRVEPWGNDCERQAVTNSLLSMQLSVAAAAVGTEMKPRDIEAFMPSDWDGRTKKKKRTKSSVRRSLEGARRIVESVFPVLKKPADFTEPPEPPGNHGNLT